jgi:hypothetical protein
MIENFWDNVYILSFWGTSVGLCLAIAGGDTDAYLRMIMLLLWTILVQRISIESWRNSNEPTD